MGLGAVGDYFVGGAIFLIACGGLYTNVMLLIKIKKRAEANPNEKMNMLYISLAITHLMDVFFLMPLDFTSSFARRWLWGSAGCTWDGALGMTVGMSMIVTMMMICFDLYCDANITDYDKMREKAIYIMLAVNWTQAIFWGVCPLLGWSTIGPTPIKTTCTMVASASEMALYTSYIFAAGWGGILIPILGMSVIYFTIGMSKSMNEKQSLIEFNSQKILLLDILVLIEWGPYAAYYFWPIAFGYEPLYLSAIASPMCKLATILTTLVLWSIVDAKNTKEGNV